MSIHHAAHNEIIKLPIGDALSGSKTATVVKTANLELIRFVIHAGKEIPLHKASNEITVQCMEGRVAFTAEGTTHELTAWQLLYLAAGVPHSLTGIEDSSLLVTLLLSKSKTAQPFDEGQEVSE